MDGILIIDKPVDWTSHDVVAKTRRILQMKRVGHTGTLDPFATGVLVILVGKATRLAQFLDKDAKRYEAVVRLGFETDTGDRTGSPKPKVQSPKSVTTAEIESVLPNFLGEIEQTPPMYSAKKIDGVKLYELARKGIEIERKAVVITNYELQITNYGESRKMGDFGLWTLDFGLRILCSAGTYIRVLAEDIGRQLETGAHLAELRRTGAGKFSIENAVTLEELEKINADEQLETVLIPMNEAISHLAEIKLSAAETVKINNGMKLQKHLPESKNGNFLRLTEAENLLAIGVYDESEQIIQPKLVLV